MANSGIHLSECRVVSSAPAPTPGSAGSNKAERALASGLVLHRKGRLEAAERQYRKALKWSPTNADTVHLLGLLKHHQGRHTVALELIGKAIAINPQHAEAHNNLALVLKELGRREEAAQAFEKSIALSPQNPETHYNLGNLLREQQRYPEAKEAYERALGIDPSHVGALNNLGTALKEQDNIGSAVNAYRRAIELAPEFPDPRFNLGIALAMQGHVDEAVATCLRAIELAPERASELEGLGKALYKNALVDEARTVYERWKELEPDNAIPSYMLAACSGQQVPERAPDAYVSAYFDGFAGNFEENLENLQYRVPGLVADALAREFPGSEPRHDALDAGCGTGLCGSALRPYARRLVGVDLSEQMLAQAREKDLYDELIVGELTDFLNRRTGAFDLIVSGDTLNYFGDLSTVFNATSAALRPGGRLVATFELDPDTAGSTRHRLNPHGRYSHAESYIRESLIQAGMSVAAAGGGTLRIEAGKPVPGLLVTAVL